MEQEMQPAMTNSAVSEFFTDYAHTPSQNLLEKSSRGFLDGITVSKKIPPVGDEQLLVFSGDGRTEDVARAIERMLATFTGVGVKRVDLGYRNSFLSGNTNRLEAAEAVKENKYGGAAVKIATVTPNRDQQRALIADFNKEATFYDVIGLVTQGSDAEEAMAALSACNTQRIALLKSIRNTDGDIPENADMSYLRTLFGTAPTEKITDARQLEQVKDAIHALEAENRSLESDVKRRVMSKINAGVEKGEVAERSKRTIEQALQGIEGEATALQKKFSAEQGSFRLHVTDVPESLFKSPNGELRGAVESYNLQREPIHGLPLDPKQPQWKNRDIVIYTPDATDIPSRSLDSKETLTLSVDGKNKNLKKNDLVMVQRHDAQAVEATARTFFDAVLGELEAGHPVMPLVSTKNTVFASDESLRAMVQSVFNKDYKQRYRASVDKLIQDAKIKEKKSLRYNQPFHALTDDMLANLISNPDWYGEKIRLFLPDAVLGQQMTEVFRALRQNGLADLGYLKQDPHQANIIHRMGVGDHYGATCGQMGRDGEIALKQGENTLLSVAAKQNDPYIVMQNAKEGFRQWAKQTVIDAVKQGKDSVYLGLSRDAKDGYYASVQKQVEQGVEEALRGNPGSRLTREKIHTGVNPTQLFIQMLTDDRHIQNAAVGLPNYLGDIYTDIAPALYGGKGGHISRLIGSTGNDILEAVHGTADSAGDKFNPIASVTLYAEALEKMGRNTGNQGIEQLGKNLQHATLQVVNDDHILPCEVQKTCEINPSGDSFYSARTGDMLHAIALRTAALQEPDKAVEVAAKLDALKVRLEADKHLTISHLHAVG